MTTARPVGRIRRSERTTTPSQAPALSLLDKLEDRLGRFAVPQLTLVVIILQVVVYGLTYLPMTRGDENTLLAIDRLQLVPDRVLEGEVWRLATFVTIPAFQNLLFALFSWYLFYLMGNALEHHWGTFRYNVFLLVGYLATVGVSFVTPDQPASAAFLGGSVFLAFAHLFPYFVIHIFFILPVQIRWLALLTWIGYTCAFLFVPYWPVRLAILAAVANFLLFFGKDILERMFTGRRHMLGQLARYKEQDRQPEFYHRCRVCGITDRSHPGADFRYCSKCDGSCCYCMEHLHSHEHVTAAGERGA